MKTAFRAPPTTCSGAASEARAVIRLLREAAARNEPCPRRVRVELPLPLADLDSDALAFAGLHGQASDWSGGIDQRFRVTKGLIDAFVLDGYENEYLGLLDRDADGMGVWKIGGSNSGGAHDATLVTHPSDTTAGFFLKLLDGAYGARVAECDHLVIVVNAFWSGSGERVGQPWEFALRRRAREVLSVKPDEKTGRNNWEKVYCARRCRSAAGVEGTLRRAWPGSWRLFDAEGVRVVLEAETEPSNICRHLPSVGTLWPPRRLRPVGGASVSAREAALRKTMLCPRKRRWPLWQPRLLLIQVGDWEELRVAVCREQKTRCSEGS